MFAFLFIYFVQKRVTIVKQDKCLQNKVIRIDIIVSLFSIC